MTRRFPLRTTALTTAASALAALTVVAGAGAAQAQDTGDDPATDPDARVCITIETFNGHRDMCLTPAVADVVGSLGYGSLGTGSLADLLSRVINTGSVALSVDVPNSVGSTGSYAPGSTGSYGPEASIGELATASTGSAAGAS